MNHKSLPSLIAFYNRPFAWEVGLSPMVLVTRSHFSVGHRSIVNTAAFHPSLPLILTSGVENHILMHGTHPIPGGQLSDPPENTRVLPPSSLPSRLIFRASTYGLDTMSMEEIELYRGVPREDRTVLMFDEYVRTCHHVHLANSYHICSFSCVTAALGRILRLEGNSDIFQTRLQVPLSDNFD